MTDGTVSVLEGNTFVVGRRNGDVDAGPGEPHGLFHRDARHLSRWLLTVDGKQLDALSTDDTKSFSARFFLVPGTGSEYRDATVSVIRSRVVGDGFFEELTVMNHGKKPMQPEIAIGVGADFADLFQVKDATIDRPGKTFGRVDGCPRALTEYPVEYPTACSPQAWATAAPLLLLHVLLGLEVRGDGIEQHPVLPERISELALRGLHGPAGTYDAVAEDAVHATA